nr:trafficking protein particle complex subunit 14-like [Nerophis lumbriciformis]
MDSLFEHSVRFPAEGECECADPAEHDALPQRTHFYLGETVPFLLLLRMGTLLREKRMDDLYAVASVGAQLRNNPLDSDNSVEEEEEEEEAEEDQRRSSGRPNRKFVDCSPLLHHNNARRVTEPVKSTQLSEEHFSFRLEVSLDKLPTDTLRAKIVVSVWEPDEELSQESYLREDLDKFQVEVSAMLNIVPPPSVGCRQLSVAGQQLTFLKVLNDSSIEDLCITNVRILPNYNTSYLPMMPDGSVLVVDNVCHQSAEVTMASFCRVDGARSRLPSTLAALEEHNFLFRMHLQDKTDDESSEGLEVPLVAMLQWRTSTLPRERLLSTVYSLPSIRLNRPGLVMSASCPSAVRYGERFRVKYTLVNNLRHFPSVRLRWDSAGGSEAVVCQSPFNNLGRCQKGSSVIFTVVFQILATGLFELSQHMKMKLQFAASPEERRSSNVR